MHARSTKFAWRLGQARAFVASSKASRRCFRSAPTLPRRQIHGAGAGCTALSTTPELVGPGHARSETRVVWTISCEHIDKVSRPRSLPHWAAPLTPPVKGGRRREGSSTFERRTPAALPVAGNEAAGSPHRALGSRDAPRFVRRRAPQCRCGESAHWHEARKCCHACCFRSDKSLTKDDGRERRTRGWGVRSGPYPPLARQRTTRTLR